MRKMWCFVMALMMCAVMSATAWADEVPVYVDGSVMAEAKVVDGATYLPMRQVFEWCGATVDYDAANKEITAWRPDGAVLKMAVGSNAAVLTENGVAKDCALAREPYVEAGRVFVPLRFVAESLLCKVDWSEGAVWIEPQYAMDREGICNYWLTCDGALYMQEWTHQEKLAQFDLAEYNLADGSEYALAGLNVVRTNAGYTVDVSIYVRNASPSSGNLRYICAQIDGDGNVVFDDEPLYIDGQAVAALRVRECMTTGGSEYAYSSWHFNKLIYDELTKGMGREPDEDIVEILSYQKEHYGQRIYTFLDVRGNTLRKMYVFDAKFCSGLDEDEAAVYDEVQDRWYNFDVNRLANVQKWLAMTDGELLWVDWE